MVGFAFLNEDVKRIMVNFNVLTHNFPGWTDDDDDDDDGGGGDDDDKSVMTINVWNKTQT
jgi:hypothetical protein